MTETPKARELNKVIRYTLFSVFKVETPPGDANRDELTYQSIVPRRSRAAVGVWADERQEVTTSSSLPGPMNWKLCRLLSFGKS